MKVSLGVFFTFLILGPNHALGSDDELKKELSKLNKNNKRQKVKIDPKLVKQINTEMFKKFNETNKLNFKKVTRNKNAEIKFSRHREKKSGKIPVLKLFQNDPQPAPLKNENNNAQKHQNKIEANDNAIKANPKETAQNISTKETENASLKVNLMKLKKQYRNCNNQCIDKYLKSTGLKFPSKTTSKNTLKNEEKENRCQACNYIIVFNQFLEILDSYIGIEKTNKSALVEKYTIRGKRLKIEISGEKEIQPELSKLSLAHWIKAELDKRIWNFSIWQNFVKNSLSCKFNGYRFSSESKQLKLVTAAFYVMLKAAYSIEIEEFKAYLLRHKVLTKGEKFNKSIQNIENKIQINIPKKDEIKVWLKLYIIEKIIEKPSQKNEKCLLM